jgi:hypothetical protein
MPFRGKLLAAGNAPENARQISGTGKTALVAVGSNQSGALQLADTYNTITTSSASTGVKLPPAEEGNLIFIYNLSGQTLTIYTNETTGVTMNNAVAGSTGVSLGNTKTAICFCPSYNTWAVTCALTST